jgi:hypothetical protein
VNPARGRGADVVEPEADREHADEVADVAPTRRGPDQLRISPLRLPWAHEILAVPCPPHRG